mmetsp:Transcript_17814/g.28838  ORF Transcript_17814/g.28838 Transcript_17814/m.28838 type:complete len:364 (+) Transcript_17814:413-1504(+)
MIYVCDDDNKSDNIMFIILASCYLAVYVLLFMYSLFLVYQFRKIVSFWVICVVGVLLMLTSAGTIASNSVSGSNHVYVLATYVVNAFIIPLFIIQLFELSYEVHRKRAVNFCFCIKVEQNGWAKTKKRAWGLRYGMWIACVGLFVLLLVDHALFVSRISPEMLNENLTLCSQGTFHGQASISETLLSRISDILAPSVLCIAALYFGIILWRYGTYYAFAVYPTYLNPWIMLICFAIIIFSSMFVKQNEVMVMSAYLLFQLSCVYTSKLVVHELTAHDSLEKYLDDMHKQEGEVYEDSGRVSRKQSGSRKGRVRGEEEDAVEMGEQHSGNLHQVKSLPTPELRSMSSDGSRASKAPKIQEINVV